jgi:hypothetical protein
MEKHRQHNDIMNSSNKETNNKADCCASDATFFAALGIRHKHNHGETPSKHNTRQQCRSRDN